MAKHNQKTVELPSGRTVTIQKLSPLGFRRIYGAVPTFATGGSEAAKAAASASSDVERAEALAKMGPEEITRNFDLAILFATNCCVEPRLAAPDELSDAIPDGFESLDDWDMEDFQALARACIDFANVAKAVEQVDP